MNKSDKLKGGQAAVQALKKEKDAFSKERKKELKNKIDELKKKEKELRDEWEIEKQSKQKFNLLQKKFFSVHKSSV